MLQTSLSCSANHLATASFDRHQHHRRMITQHQANSRLWSEKSESDNKMLELARLEFDRRSDALLINAERGAKAAKITSTIQQSACAVFFCYRVFSVLSNPTLSSDSGDLRKIGLQLVLAAIGLANPVSSCLPLLATNLPRIAISALPILNLTPRLFNIFTKRSEGNKAKASDNLKQIQANHKEHLRMGSAELEALDKFLIQVSQDDRDELQLFRESAKAIKVKKN